MDIKKEELFWEVHRGLAREAPGSNAATCEALKRIPSLPPQPEILDIGCGPGMQTLELARETRGNITAVDTHQPFLDQLAQSAQREGLISQVQIMNGSMFELNFQGKQFDLIWSEGAIYIIGFLKGLETWKPLLKLGGYLAVTEISWLKQNVPEEPKQFWQEGYPAITTIEKNILTIQKAGYRFIDHFTIPESAWWGDYYKPMLKRIEELRKKYKTNPEALKIFDSEEREINLYRNYSEYYGYVFYIIQHGT